LTFAAPTINVGTIYLIPNQAGQNIDLTVSNVSPPAGFLGVNGFDLFAQIGDGVAAGPVFSGATLTAAGSIFASNNIGDQNMTLGPAGPGAKRQVAVSVVTNSGYVTPSGTVGRLTVDTTGITRSATPGANQFALSLTAPGPTSFVGDDGATPGDDVIPTTITNGNMIITVDGDANLNGVVDFTDLSILLNNYKQPAPRTWQQGNIDKTGIVDFTDLSILLNNYKRTATPLTGGGGNLMAGASVPEPSSMVMLGLGGMGLLGFGVRKARRRLMS